MQYVHVVDPTNLPEGAKIVGVWEYFSKLQKDFSSKQRVGEIMRCR